MALVPIEGASRADLVLDAGRIIDMEAMALWLDPDAYFFEFLTRKIGKIRDKTRMKFNYRTRPLYPQVIKITTISAADAGTITVDHPEYTHTDVLLYNTRSEEMYISQDSNPGAGALTVSNVNGTATISKATVLNDKILILGESHAEGEAVPPAFSVQEEEHSDSIMQKDRRIETTDIQENEAEYDPMKQRARDTKAAWIEYKREQDLLFYAGQSNRDVTTATPRRRHCMGGIMEKITKSRDLEAVVTGLTLQVISDVLGETRYHGASSSKKFGIFGTYGWAAISAMPVNQLRVAPETKAYGIQINEIITGHGRLPLGFDPVLCDDNGLADRGFIIDTKHIRQVRLQGLPVHLAVDVPSLSTLHTTADVITGTFGLETNFGSDLHMQFTNIH